MSQVIEVDFRKKEPIRTYDEVEGIKGILMTGIPEGVDNNVLMLASLNVAIYSVLGMGVPIDDIPLIFKHQAEEIIKNMKG